MIIDTHAHLFSWDIPAKPYWDMTAKVWVELFGGGRTVEEVKGKIPRLFDTLGDKLVSDMDEGGIDKSVILLIDYMTGGVEDSFSLEEQHRVYARAVERHPDRLIFFAGVDPRRPDAVDFLPRAVKEWNVKGVKLHPSVGWYPNEPCAYRVYEKCRELGLPVLIHSGPEIPPMYQKYADPVFFDEIATDFFPDLKIIMAHAGMSEWEEAALLGGSNPNLYFDFAGWQKFYIALPEEEFYRRIRVCLNLCRGPRFFFGSDWPILTRMRHLNHADWTNVFKEAPERAWKYGIEFSEEEISGILGGNVAKLLGLS